MEEKPKKEKKAKRVLLSFDLTADEAVEAIKKQLGIKSFEELERDKPKEDEGNNKSKI